MLEPMILLDVIAPILSPSMLLFVVFMLLCISLEAFVIERGLDLRLKKAFFQSFLANVFTTIVGFWYVDFYSNQLYLANYWLLFASGFLFSIVLELLALRLLNKGVSIKKLSKTSFFMNLVSYAILIIIYFFSRY